MISCNIKDGSFVNESHYKSTNSVAYSYKAYIGTSGAEKSSISITSGSEFCISDNLTRTTPICGPLKHGQNLWFFANNTWAFYGPANFKPGTYIGYYKNGGNKSNNISLTVKAVNTTYSYDKTSSDSKCKTGYVGAFCDITTSGAFSSDGSHYK